MGLQYKVRSSSTLERWYELRFEEVNGPEQTEIRLPPEWFPQSGVQLTWPHAGTDWCYMLEEVTDCYVRMAYEIASREPLLIVTPERTKVETLLKEKLPAQVFAQIRWADCPTDDTWARDHGFITLIDETGPLLLDFCFNGWGKKFSADQDNRINRSLMKQGVLNGTYTDHLDFVLEGGSIESDGHGTLLTTSECLLSANRNDRLNRADIEERLKSFLHVERVLWLDHGYLSGDDTDSHIDTLARFCPDQTIAYVKCENKEDEHYEALLAMEEQLKTFRTLAGEPYHLLALPMADKIEEDGERLPATYANFLIMNDVILYPTYNQQENDKKAGEVLQQAFPNHQIIGIDCRALIKQHGSLHCVTMQYPLGVIKES